MPRINIDLIGGLGNTMFQYALGKALSHYGHDVTLNRSALVDRTTSNVFDSRASEYGLEGFHTTPVLGGRIGEYIEEGAMPFKPAIFALDRDATLHGYWQTEKYFLPIADVLRFEFYPMSSPNAFARDAWTRIDLSENSIGLHVRRGERIQHPENLIVHGVVEVGYYLRAVAYIQAQYPDSEVFVFSDDPEWCRQNLGGTVISTGDRFWDLWLMSRCRHLVIPNSSFSWWAAWLGDTRTDRIVVVPKPWFLVDYLDTRDLVPERWVQMERV